ncbi:hypothetical protein LT350_16520 [Mycolicibacterium smegmatis]|jgi:hypothetical protein|uniref:hypothetical protein n=1 Tax=Mycolicibacterium smegmatis TaxID=1772 RepID=UPI001E2C5994|nr:hypothetical protein [Mycolicibacterium smegmatis]UGU34414.1 hypothetical protein LT350_16520 [Mycolicibacterium smegmatis]ULN69243.1 hypothetical protein KZ782_27060 [Mycolicibacterium smegmatis]
MSQTPPAAPQAESGLVEVWGDTVNERHVIVAVLLGASLAVPTFLLAHRGFAAAMDNQDLAKTYAMLAGLGACLVSAIISARLFEPKRIVTEQALDREQQIAAALDLARQPLGMGRLADLDEAGRDELRRLGLYEVFAEAERRLADEQAGGTDAPAPEEVSR